ncbi:hypothetical protein GIB67_029022 [Kingdonia uniflora]|uniref:Transposase MuDR plant domain-containing protein n=1 Tax=Kingdonia uniflora TaxID=39325 RepID=A0A7J7N6N7_9MAGN|nr:hypothetical protein GIB67_029022 [Kingdonia uniflora]
MDIENLVAEEGYYNTHSSQDGDDLPTPEEMARGEEFDGIDAENDNIFTKEDADMTKEIVEPMYKELKVGMQWPTVDYARKYFRKFVVIKKFSYSHIKNESFRLRMKCTDEKCKWLAFVSRLPDEHTMELKGHYFEHDCKGTVGAVNKMAGERY